MRHNFKKSFHGSAVASQSVEKDPVEGDNTTPHSTSLPRVLCLYQQHITDYVYLCMEEGKDLTLSEDQANPLFSILFSSFCFLVH